MRIVAKIILSALELGLIALIGLPLLAYAGVVRLIDWAELHAQFGGDVGAQDRARWREI